MAEIVVGTRIKLIKGYRMEGWPRTGDIGTIMIASIYHENVPKDSIVDDDGHYWAYFDESKIKSLCIGGRDNFEVLEDIPCETEDL